jgi:hypothetical protein
MITAAAAMVVLCAGTADAATRGWVIQATPNPAGSDGSYLEGVTCTSATSCTAVGYYIVEDGNAEDTLAEYWNGSTWAIQATPNPADSRWVNLYNVSCTSATNCTAVGAYSNSAGSDYSPLAEQWNGSTWTILTAPVVAGATSTWLAGVSCPTATNCTAAGRYTSSAGDELALVEHWNGTAWTVQTTPLPAGANEDELAGIACTSASHCTAVGFYSTSAGNAFTLAEVRTGSTWAVQSTPNPSDGSNDLAAISCHTATNCTATGSDFSNATGVIVTLAEHWNGSTWAAQSTPSPANPRGAIGLYSVSCSSATSCTAVGWSDGNGLPLVEHWNGTVWTAHAPPRPAGSDENQLNGISCVSPTTCTAVGASTGRSGPFTTLVITN